jgi:hypothetical protein
MRPSRKVPAVSTTARARKRMPTWVTAPTTVALHHQVVHGLLEQPEVRLVLQAAADGGLVEDAVGLGPGGAHRRPLAGVEDAELDAALVGGQGHGAAQRVHLLDQVALADAADRGVAAHLPQRLDVVGEQQGGAAHAGRGQGGLGAGMATAHHDDVEFLGIQHEQAPARRTLYFKPPTLGAPTRPRPCPRRSRRRCFTWNNAAMDCRPHCAACCIAPSISSPSPACPRASRRGALRAAGCAGPLPDLRRSTAAGGLRLAAALA